MSTNFLQWNPGGTNQENDSQYAGDAQRASGATSPSLFAAVLANKAFYQWSSFIAALAQSMSNKGYAVSDANYANLVAVLANLITAVDLIPYAPKNSPVFTGDPQAPTQATGDNDQSLATTAFVKNVLGAAGGFQVSLGINGYIKFPLVLGGLILQWMTGPVNPATGEQNFTVNFPLAFPIACLNVQVSVLCSSLLGNSGDFSYQVISRSNSSVHIDLQEFSGGRDVSAQCFIFAIGN